MMEGVHLGVKASPLATLFRLVQEWAWDLLQHCRSDEDPQRSPQEQLPKHYPRRKIASLLKLVMCDFCQKWATRASFEQLGCCCWQHLDCCRQRCGCCYQQCHHTGFAWVAPLE